MDTHTSRVRPFADHDYPRYVEIGNAALPEVRSTVAEARHDDAARAATPFARVRLVAEDESGLVIGRGEFGHTPDQFYPGTFWLQLQVDPPHRRRGVGGTLYDALQTELQRRGAVDVRTEAQESTPESRLFLERRCFVEADRAWESRLDLATFDDEPFAGAAARIAAEGIAITTLDAERTRRPDALRAAYELHVVCQRDMPSLAPITPVPFAHLVDFEVDQPSALPDGYFLATDGDRYVGQTTLFASAADPGVLYQGLTGVHPAYRGRGLALALKLRTIAYARERGDHQIRTWNNARNRPMLRINEALGFAKQPAWVIFRNLIASDSPDPETHSNP